MTLDSLYLKGQGSLLGFPHHLAQVVDAPH